MAGGSESKGAVVAALFVNTLLTVLKFIAFAFSGSGSMFAEAMHSLADAGNQMLLFIGIKRSEKPASEMFTYGHGQERFLFALLSAVGIFVLGCGVTVYHGVSTLIDPHPVQVGWFDFVILGVAFVLDAWVLWKAIKAINKMRGDVPFLKFLKNTDDPTVGAVLLEDGVACLGIVIAFTGIIISQLTHSTIFDSLGSIAIGGLLGFIAVWLGVQNRSLIIGRAIPPEVQEKVIAYLNEQPSIERVRFIQSRVIGASNYKLKADIDWNGRWFGEQHQEWLSGQKSKVESDAKTVSADFGEKITQAIAEEIDRVETELRKQIPELTYLDFEGDATSGNTPIQTSGS